MGFGMVRAPGQMPRVKTSTQGLGGTTRSMAGASCSTHLGVCLKESGQTTKNKGSARCTGLQPWSGTGATGRMALRME